MVFLRRNRFETKGPLMNWCESVHKGCLLGGNQQMCCAAVHNDKIVWKSGKI